MKQKIETYKIVCDHCGETFEDGNGYVCYTEDIDGSLIWQEAEGTGWIEHKGKHYCPNCWEYDDNDNVITVEGKEYEETGNS